MLQMYLTKFTFPFNVFFKSFHEWSNIICVLEKKLVLNTKFTYVVVNQMTSWHQLVNKVLSYGGAQWCNSWWCLIRNLIES